MPTFSRCLDCGARFQKTKILRSRCETCHYASERDRDNLRNAKRPGGARKSLPRKVKKRDGDRCIQCGSPVRLEVHHITPLSAGGTNDETNMVTLCHDCHARAHSRGGRG